MSETKQKEGSLAEGFRKLYPFIKPYQFRAALAIILTIPIGAMDAVIAWSLKPYMDIVLLQESANSAKSFSAALVPLLIVGFSLTQSLLNYVATYLNTWAGQKITMGLKKTLYNKLIHYNASFFDKQNSGDILFRFNNDADLACAGLLSHIKMFTTRFFSSISLIIVLLYNSWQLAILAIFVLGAALYPLTTIRKKIKSLMDRSVFSGAAVMTQYNETFNGNRIITSYNLYDRQNKSFNTTLDSLFTIGIKVIQRTGLLSPLMHFIVSLGIAGVIWLGSYLIAQGEITAGNFVSFITALIMLYTPIKQLGSTYTSVQMSLMAVERIFEVLEKEPEIKDKEEAKPLNEACGVIEYKDVCFEYTENKPVLKGVNLTVNAGQTVAFVGNSGGGKTTMVNLLPRFYEVKSGSITINGEDIRDVTLESLRDNIAIVFQDNFLFAGTIRTNLLVGKEDATDEELMSALKSACLDDFIESLEDGLETQIGERGILLSGGQKQRIAIARAFLKDSPIVILDEATSALDTKSEAIVQKAIENLMQHRTVFVIAHRLSTVRNADKIVVVNQGEIAEMGTHNELIEKDNSIYASLYKTQLV